MEAKPLEDFRANDFNDIVFILSTKPPMSLTIRYDLYAIHAYRFTSRCISDLENSANGINNGIECIPAVQTWHGAVDCFLNVLLQLFCLRTGEDFEMLSLLPLNGKYAKLFSQLAIPGIERNEQLHDRLEDFARFEKWMRRDFVAGSHAVYKKANFSSRPAIINQADVIQCALISLELFQYLRFCIAGLDLMPNISLQFSGSDRIVYDKLDLLFRSVIVPAFRDVLSKQKLTCALNFDEPFTSIPKSPVFLERQVVIAGKIVEDEEFKRNTEIDDTNSQGFYFAQFSKKYEGLEERFNRHYLAPGFDFFPKGS